MTILFIYLFICLFILNYEDKAYHNFLQHYQDGGNLRFEAKPIEIKRYEGLIHYLISFDKHTEFYNFTIMTTLSETLSTFLN